MIAEGAKPCLLAPYSFTHLPHPVVAPESKADVGNRPQPCLVLNNIFYFFQVSFSVFPEVPRVDVLTWDESGWNAIELNGAGHEPSNDHLRTKEIGLPVKYLFAEDVVKRSEYLVSSSGTRPERHHNAR
jgi:hypothetical protein